MGRRSRQRARTADTAGALDRKRGLPAGAHGAISAPVSQYTDEQAGTLCLRGSLSAASRERYRAALRAGLEREDAWQRATEMLFEHLAVSWTVHGVRTERQRELLARYRAASAQERAFVRESLRAHLAEHFPELPAP
jgi:hypothetical protein